MQRGIRILIYSANSHAHFDQELKNGGITLSQEIKGLFVIPFHPRYFIINQCINIFSV